MTIVRASPTHPASGVRQNRTRPPLCGRSGEPGGRSFMEGHQPRPRWKVTAHRLIVRSCAERDSAIAIGVCATSPAGLGRLFLARVDAAMAPMPRWRRWPAPRMAAVNRMASFAPSSGEGFPSGFLSLRRRNGLGRRRAESSPGSRKDSGKVGVTKQEQGTRAPRRRAVRCAVEQGLTLEQRVPR